MSTTLHNPNFAGWSVEVEGDAAVAEHLAAGWVKSKPKTAAPVVDTTKEK